MTTLRKLELAAGILAGAMSTYVGLTYIWLDAQTSERLGASPVNDILFLSVVFLLPAVAVLVGSLLHSLKRNRVGQFLLLIGSLVNIVIFLSLVSTVPVAVYGRPHIFWLSLMSATLAVATSIISVLVQRTRNFSS